MKFLITGGTGLIGTRLSRSLIENGHSVNILSRKFRKSANPSQNYFTWNPEINVIDKNCIKNVDIIINLAGSSVFSFWTKSNKKKILKSRISSLDTIYNLLINNKHQVKRIISASAIGIYPNHKSKIYDESSDNISNTFLGKIVFDWELKVKSFKNINIDISLIRIGLVLSEKGGLLEKLLQINSLRISSIIENGEQWQSWIHIEDLVKIFYFVQKNKINGIVNAVAPNPLTFNELQKFISSHYRRPIISLNLPKFLFTTPLSLLGMLDFYHDIIASNKKVSSKKIMENGYKFIYSSISQIK